MTKTQSGDGHPAIETQAMPTVLNLCGTRRFSQRFLDLKVATMESVEVDAQICSPSWLLVEMWCHLEAVYPETAVTGGRGMSAHAGVGHAGRAWTDAPTRDPAIERVRTPRPDGLASHGPARHPESVAKKEDAAVDSEGPDIGHVVGLGGEGCGKSEDTAISPRGTNLGDVVAVGDTQRGLPPFLSFGADHLPRSHKIPCPRPVSQLILQLLSGFFPAFPALENWRVHIPRTRDRLQRVEPRSPNSCPGPRP